jgi:CelD/BcsL family acetyltransferase involved in cellulose biosynthesis
MASARRSVSNAGVLRSFDALEQLRSRLLERPRERVDADPDFFRAVVESRPEVVSPYVLVPEPGADPIVARLEDVEVPLRLGYLTLSRPRVRSITVVPGGVPDSLEPTTVTRTLGASLARGDADVVVLPALRADSELYAAAAQTGSLLTRPRAITPSMHWRLNLPSSYEEFLRSRSRKARENARMYRNRLHRDAGDAVELRIFRRVEDLDQLLSDLSSLAARTYQHGLGVAFADDEERRRLTRLGMERGWFRAYVLYVRGEAVAFWQGVAYNGTFFTGTPGYDPAFAQYSVGTLVLLHLIEDLIAEPDVHAVDYGFGDADYKRRFGTESRQEVDVWLFASRPRPIALNLVRATTAAANRASKHALESRGLADRLKKRWRARIARGTSP